jgi:hypothetical protein
MRQEQREMRIIGNCQHLEFTTHHTLGSVYVENIVERSILPKSIFTAAKSGLRYDQFHFRDMKSEYLV